VKGPHRFIGVATLRLAALRARHPDGEKSAAKSAYACFVRIQMSAWSARLELVGCCDTTGQIEPCQQIIMAVKDKLTAHASVTFKRSSPWK
jgi:hypothetical protein